MPPAPPSARSVTPQAAQRPVERLQSDFAALAAAQAGGAGPADGAGPAGDGFVVQTGLGAMPLLPADLPVLVEALAEAVRSGPLAPPDTIRPPRAVPVS